MQINAPYPYVAVMTWADAMVKAGSAVLENYLPALAKIQYRGVTRRVAFDKRGDIRDGTLTLHTFKAGHHTVLAITKRRGDPTSR